MPMIYGIFIPSRRKVYVGATWELCPAKRWWAHVRNLQAKRHHCRAFQDVVDEVGEAELVFRVLERVASADGVCAAEQKWVDHYAAMGCLLNAARRVRPLRTMGG